MDPWSDQRRDSAKNLMWGIEMNQLKEQRMETRMDPCSDQRRDSMKDLQWGTKLDRL